MTQKNLKRSLVVLAVSAGLSGCAKDGSMALWGKCSLLGGGTGAILGAIDSSAAAGWGALGGAALGGILCALKDDDSDNDGVPDGVDVCPDTPKGVEVNAKGCPLDSDGDGIADYKDKCPNTRPGTPVNSEGCPDSDGDGVADNLDRCPNTPAGALVDKDGCPTDSDNDGVPDGIDRCPDTPAGISVDQKGCPLNRILGEIYFEFDKSTLSAEARQKLDEAARVALQETDTQVKVVGYTDDKGDPVYNTKLSQQRADAAMKYLKEKGVPERRIDAEGKGALSRNNATREERRKNRKVDIMLVR